MSILGRVADKLERNQFDFCRQMLLRGAKHEIPKPDPERDSQFDFPAYSPSPRHEAACGLLRLATCQADEEMLESIESLASDPVPSVRMVAAAELFRIHFKASERFWQIVEDRATHEIAYIVQDSLCSTLIRVVAKKKENENMTTQVMGKLLNSILSFPEKLNSSNSFIALLMWLVINRNNSWASETIKDTFF